MTVLQFIFYGIYSIRLNSHSWHSLEARMCVGSDCVSGSRSMQEAGKTCSVEEIRYSRVWIIRNEIQNPIGCGHYDSRSAFRFVKFNVEICENVSQVTLCGVMKLWKSMSASAYSESVKCWPEQTMPQKVIMLAGFNSHLLFSWRGYFRMFTFGNPWLCYFSLWVLLLEWTVLLAASQLVTYPDYR